MTQQDDFTRIFSCSQCPKMFATRSNLKRHMENPNIHNIPYVRSRDQKRWKGHAKKVVSKEETTERMRKWRAENREKNRQNDLRCRVYRLARQKFGDQDSLEKQTFIRDEIIRRLGRRINIKSKSSSSSTTSSTSAFSSTSPPSTQQVKMHRHRHHPSASSSSSSSLNEDDENDTNERDDVENRVWKSELPFYNMPHQKIELPSIDSLCPSLISSTSLRRRTSSSSESSISTTTTDDSSPSSSSTSSSVLVLPPVHTFLYPSSSYQQPLGNATNIKYVKNTKILDEFVGVVLDYAQDDDDHHHHHHHHH
ncbi:uncharacterized protein BX664DRAFT_388640 [Halteromyces radiatus]|uniref:uncharacterized protein n=1 Tax=Halteromyces radiatus TaxID=101107 RepID=UPI00221FB6BD|nr:uncharacterized protein BX664DRAFT_388640 [Halteromyces radiatus]KAI8081694.1 hypothetical protein BX664DRAFT_388640 [Halteromyces radiatus]